jgi:hypothetical protein
MAVTGAFILPSFLVSPPQDAMAMMMNKNGRYFNMICNIKKQPLRGGC